MTVSGINVNITRTGNEAELQKPSDPSFLITVPIPQEVRGDR